MIVTIVSSPYDHPYYHLSLEEFLLKQEPFEGPYVLFYVNRPSVIMGRNQNPWRECDVGAIQRDQVVLGRRMTGGGTVYHDYGNLNYAVIYQHSQFSDKNIMCWLINGFKQLGFDINIGQRKELLLNGLKISGTAFGRYQNKVIQHGTLLVSADLKTMEHYLKIDTKIELSRAVKSVPSQVVNLQTYNANLDLKTIIKTLEAALDLPTIQLPIGTLNQIMGSSEYLKVLDKHQSWKWIFGETPSFSLVNPLNATSPIEIQRGKIVNGTKETERIVKQDYPAIRIDQN